jgi:hypothetical protein
VDVDWLALSVILPPKIYNEVFRELDSIELTSPK